MKRGVAGSMVFVMFDQHALLSSFASLSVDKNQAENLGYYQFVSDKDEPRPNHYVYNSIQKNDLDSRNVLGFNTNTIEGTVIGAQSINTEEGIDSKLDSGWERVSPWYSDQIPPFNVVLTGVNEFGAAATMAVLGVEILNEGYGISIDDIISEQQMTYVARGISPWTKISGAGFQQIGGAQYTTFNAASFPYQKI